VAVAAAFVVVLAAVGGAWALTRDDDNGDGGLTTHPAATSAPSGSDLELAVASLADALAKQAPLDDAQAECAARAWIESAGLQQMIDAGFFDADLNYVDRPQSEMTPDLRNAAVAAVTSCLAT
jgi:hypothetical protein